MTTDHTSPHRLWVTWTTVVGTEGRTAAQAILVDAQDHAEADQHRWRIGSDIPGWLTRRGWNPADCTDVLIAVDHVHGCHGCNTQNYLPPVGNSVSASQPVPAPSDHIDRPEPQEAF